MMIKTAIVLVVILLVGLASVPADAQQPAATPQAAATPKGVTTKGLVTSLGGFSATVNAPIFLTGATVELEPGGQTGRQLFRVPTYILVLDGVLTTDYEAGPIGVKGIQYHATGQSHMDSSGVWHNYMNRTDKPVKFLMLHLGYPGATPIQKPEPE